jgi:tetratricopeptide (TPR) repeat protein
MASTTEGIHGGPHPAAVDEFTEEEVRLLDYASAVGHEFELTVLADAMALSPGEVEGRVKPLAARGLLQEKAPGRFGFAEEEFRLRVYQSMTESHLRIVHSKLAEAIERRNPEPGPEVISELGRHFFLGKSPRKSWLYNRRAATLARSEYRLESAIHHLERARRDLTGLPGDHGRELDLIEEELGDLRRTMGRLEAAEGSYLQALLHTPPEDAANRIRLLLAHSSTSIRLNRVDLAVGSVTEALELSRRTKDPKGEGQAHRVLSHIAYKRGDYREALEESMAALELLEGAGDPRALSDCFVGLALAFTQLGPEVAEDAALWYRRAIEVFDKVDDPYGRVRAYAHLAAVVGRTDPVQGREYVQRALETAERIQWTHWIARILFLGIEFRLALGEREEAERDHQRGTRLLERAPDPQAAVLGQLSRGMIAERRGFWEEAEEAYRNAAAQAKALGEMGRLAEAELRRARLLFKTHDLEGARDAYLEAEALNLPKLVPALRPSFEELRHQLEEAGLRPAPPGRGL